MDGFQKEQVKKLRANGMSYGDIAKRVNVTRNAVISFCRRNGLQEQSITAGSLKNSGDICRACGNPLVQTEGMKRRVFCSKECRISWWKAHPEMIRQKAIYSFTCAHCGRAFTAYGNNARKYCSHNCYIAARFGGTADE